MELDYFYPKNIISLLINNEDGKIPKIKLYKNFKTSKIIKDIYQKELDLNKENYDYNTAQSKLLTKEQLEKLKNIKIFSFTKNLKNLIKTPKGWSNAYRKIYEICMDTEFISQNMRNKHSIRHFDLCSSPGSFLYGVNDYINSKTNIKKYDFYFQSYVSNDDDNYFKDRYSLAKKYPDRFLIKNKGDISSLEEINYYQEYFKNNKCDIISSDCGLENLLESDYTREKQMTKTFLGQFIAGLVCLKEKGNFVMKYYHFYSPFNISLIYLMGLLFKKVYLVKPSSSRQFTGKEIYILCIEYKNNLSSKILEDLKNILLNFKETDINMSILSYTVIDKEKLNNLEKKLSEYYDFKLNLTINKYKYVDDFIGIDVRDNFEEYLKKKKELFKQSELIEIKYYKEYIKKMNFKKIDYNKIL